MSQIIIAIAKMYGIPGSLLLAICTHESGLKNIISPNDHGSPSYGVCQIKENTAKLLGFTVDIKKLMDPKTNITIAAKYLRKQLDRYDGDWCMATAAYNAGRYNPSKIYPGRPKNLKYVQNVTLLIGDAYKDLLICGSRKVASE